MFANFAGGTGMIMPKTKIKGYNGKTGLWYAYQYDTNGNPIDGVFDFDDTRGEFAPVTKDAMGRPLSRINPRAGTIIYKFKFYKLTSSNQLDPNGAVYIDPKPWTLVENVG